MVKTMKILGTMGVFVSLLVTAACGSSTPTSTPTLDLNPLRTEVASTVLAEVANDLALTPSIPCLPCSTDSLPPTATPTKTPSASPTALLTEAIDVTATVAITSTPGTETINLAEWVAQSVPDDTIFGPGETFTMTWRLKNVGNSTWTTGYRLRFYSGDAFGAPSEILLTQEVPPDSTVDVNLQMKAPARPGTYQSVWVMSTENRSNFKEPVYLQIIVAVTPTPTRTPIPTTTPTP